MVYLHRLLHFSGNTLFAKCPQPDVTIYNANYQQIKHGASGVTITTLGAWFLLPLQFAMESLLLLLQKNSLID